VREGGTWWQDALLWALRSKKCTAEELTNLSHSPPVSAAEVGAPLPVELKLLLRYGALPVPERNRALESLSSMLALCSGARLLLSVEEIRTLEAENVTIGAHGMSHLPLTHTPNSTLEMKHSLRWLSETLEKPFVPTMSFPHGRWDEDLVSKAKSVGFEIMFTSNPVLNPCPSGWLQSDVVGRISVDHGALTNRVGEFSQARGARWFFSRDHIAPSPHRM
jgi:hypothetical protein